MRAKFYAAGLLLLSSLSASAHPRLDGHWRVDAVTTVGNCQRSAQAVVTVESNHIVGVDAFGIEPWGYIYGAGTIVARFSQGGHVLRAEGAVRGGAASGAWSSNTDFCGGRWTARKID